jgi:restriction system protein
LKLLPNFASIENKTNMKKYFRLMLGANSALLDECLRGNFIAVGFIHNWDLTNHLYENWRDFNKMFIPIWIENNPRKSKVAAGLACGSLWTFSKSINRGDIIISPDGRGNYHIAEVLDDYTYHPGQTLPHRRNVKWYDRTFERAQMSDSLKNSSGSVGTISNISKYSQEIEVLISSKTSRDIISNDETVENSNVFALENHLEDFLVRNWKNTKFGKNYDIYTTEEGEIIGRQYPTDTGRIDILAISKDGQELLVIELKRARASDEVVGQIQRYMGYVQEELLEEGQRVKGIIIALEEDLRIRRALVVAPNIDFYRYQISFDLFKL